MLARGAAVPERAVRELLALQASDWAFLETRRLAGPYALERSEGHLRGAGGGAGTGTLGPRGARALPEPHRLPAARTLTFMSPASDRVLILSWEYPPIVEGGLARHVRKLSEALVALGTEVHVLTRGDETLPAEEVMHGVTVHRVREPGRPQELGEFVTWIEHMNADMLAAGVELGDRYRFDLVHGHDWLVAVACDHLANRFRCPLVMTIHATEYGRHQGWVDKHPQSHIHGVESWITQPRRARHHLLALHARARLRHLRPRREPRSP